MNAQLSTGWKIGLAAVLAGSPASLLAGGFRLPDQDAFATARGEAFVATADNPSAIYYNPAGIAQLEGQNLRGGFYGIDLDPTFTAHGGSHTFHNENKLAAVPQFFYTYSAANYPVTGGLGIYAPYGLSLKWPQNTGFRTLATEASLTYVTINPVVAFKLSDRFFIGGGVTVNYADELLRQGLVWPAQPNDGFQFRGNGWDVGYNLGALAHLSDQVSVGASFRSGTRIDLTGHVEDHNNVALPGFPAYSSRSAAHADFPFPINAIFGISYRPTTAWNFEFNADYTDWSSLQTVFIEQANSPVLPKNIPFTLDWEPSWYFEFGGTRFLDNGWHVSAGYVYNENSMPNAHFTPFVTDMDKHFFSVGAGHKGKRLNFDVAYQFGYGSRDVSGSAPSAAGQTADGNYTFISHAVIVSAGLAF
jgi:long-chain fatty acid transport protein